MKITLTIIAFTMWILFMVQRRNYINLINRLRSIIPFMEQVKTDIQDGTIADEIIETHNAVITSLKDLTDD